jgi:hypothetical protein
VDPAAAALVERQRRDRYAELRRILRANGSTDRGVFAQLAVLTSFETYRELRHAGLALRTLERTLHDGAHRVVGQRASRAVATSSRKPSGSRKNVA